MSPEAIRAGATILADLRLRTHGRHRPLESLPADCRPHDLAQAYAMQAVARQLISKRGLGEITGWKIGCTTPVMQDYLSIPHPCAGTLYQRTTYHRQAELIAADFFQLGLECEIAVRLQSDLTAMATAHDRASVREAVGEVMTSVEIVEHRFSDFARAGTPSLVADDFFSVGCVIGAPQPLSAVADLQTLSGGFGIDGAPAEETGSGKAILGHPLNALAWLANHMIELGSGLQAGQIITLGSVVKTIYPRAGTLIEARFDRLDPVGLRIL